MSRVYCINSECSKHDSCSRYSEVPMADGSSKKFDEYWNGKSCSKFRALSGGGNLAPQSGNHQRFKGEEPTAFFSSIPQEMELREHLVRHIEDNLDLIFSGDPVWQERTHSYGKIASRIVDLMMPHILFKRSIRPTYK